MRDVLNVGTGAGGGAVLTLLRERFEVGVDAGTKLRRMVSSAMGTAPAGGAAAIFLPSSVEVNNMVSYFQSITLPHTNYAVEMIYATIYRHIRI